MDGLPADISSSDLPFFKLTQYEMITNLKKRK